MTFSPGTETVLQRALRSAGLITSWLLGWWILTADHASAQPLGEVVVVPFGAPELSAPLVITDLLEKELTEARVSLIPLHDARDRFTARSRPPLTATDSDLDVLARAAHDAIEHVAFGRTAAAQKSVREVISRAERTLESLNRETATARHILDACLSLVRSALQGGKRDLALEQATRCRRLVPDLMPSEDAHPANVVGVLAEADNLLRRMRIGNLTVRSAPESGCSVYLNGRHLGTTPFRLDRAAAGDYRVQVECGKSLARVHVVQLGDQPASLLVDTQFDRAVASDPRLLLRYTSARDAREQAVSHAIQLGREIGASDVILVGLQNDRAELLRVQVDQQRLVARASVPWSERHGFSQPAIDQAIVVLAEARLQGQPSVQQDPTNLPEAPAPSPAQAKPSEPTIAEADDPAKEAAPVSEQAAADADMEEDAPAPAEPEQPGRRNRRRTRELRTGYGLLAGALAFTAVGVGFEWRAQRLNTDLSELDPSEDEDSATTLAIRDLQPKFDRASNLRWLGLAGPLMGTAASVLLVQPRAHVPWWGYAFAGVGAGLITVGAVEITRREECLIYDQSGSCRRELESHARGALLIGAALPLLTVPLTQWLRKTTQTSYAFAPSVQPGRFALSVHGRF
jgi:hypothetical protein